MSVFATFPNLADIYTSFYTSLYENQQNDCAPSENSDQPGHPPSLIRVFAVRMKKAWILTTHRAHSEDSDQAGRIRSHFVGFHIHKLLNR